MALTRDKREFGFAAWIVGRRADGVLMGRLIEHAVFPEESGAPGPDYGLHDAPLPIDAGASIAIPAGHILMARSAHVEGTGSKRLVRVREAWSQGHAPDEDGVFALMAEAASAACPSVCAAPPLGWDELCARADDLAGAPALAAAGAAGLAASPDHRAAASLGC